MVSDLDDQKLEYFAWFFKERATIKMLKKLLIAKK